ncbi:cation diffusion facilitator 10 [Patellaria atrata CBS 101060]|uniref:Cation diffusion facilitator 10 n=1 Tax=Patellaria atrata CBS 101060 TaxID=1346257 RepID=A0A9P4VQ76_9PEZI|nr:cation diffusion facilitator 10 [Patellaria atrata CBS 101060]
MSSPSQSYRFPSLKGFLPLSEDSSLSTRGQTLPALLQSLTQPLSRRPSSVRLGSQRGEDDVEQGRRSLDGTGGYPERPGLGIGHSERDRRLSHAEMLNTPQMRSMRLIGNANPRYKWEQYYKTEGELKKMKKSIRKYYERNNLLIQQYVYIDKLLDSSIPHDLIQEYNNPSIQVDVPPTISEEGSLPSTPHPNGLEHVKSLESVDGSDITKSKTKRTAKDIYRVPTETSALLGNDGDEQVQEGIMPDYEPEEDTSSGAPIVTLAIYVNLAANTALLIMKIIVTIMTSSLSVIASLVDAALDFLSTAIVWTTTRMISNNDKYGYPVGRRRLEPLGVLIFSVIMITSFVQVFIEGFNRLIGADHSIVKLTIPAIAIMSSTVVIKFFCWLWCRLIKNSSVQALAQDAMTDVVFNIFSIIFPLIGYYAHIWWMDPLGGMILSLYVIINWSRTSVDHIRNLSGAAATPDERNVLLYLTMRFAKTVKQIQGLQAYHAGDKLVCEVDLVLDENTSLRDSHDLGESLQYVLESVPTVDRAFVHLDYAGWNLPSHLQQED